VVQDKRYPYIVSGAVLRARDTSAFRSALLNGDVVDEKWLMNSTKHPMRVSKLSAHRSVERGWATNQKGDVSVVERGWALNSKGWDGWWVGHVSTFTARNINAISHYVTALTHSKPSGD